ncbi:MAG: hypothetical protein HY875_14635 [Chloroflexi bacterium]|nr:hypothetical protein [Chloroflexota bacterium]
MTTGQPPQHSPGFEPEALSTAHFLRGAFITAFVIIGLIVLVSVLGVIVSRQRNENAGAGQDVHAPLAAGTVAEADTESGRKIAVVIQSLAWEAGPVLDVKVEGVAVEPGAWTFVLQDGTVLQAEATRNTDGTVHLRLPASAPATSTVRSIHFNPDSSRGDVYFDVQD